MAQWYRICLPVQETWVRILIQEDSTRHGATKPMPHNYRACAPEPKSCHCRAYALQLLKPEGLNKVVTAKRNQVLQLRDKSLLTETTEKLVQPQRPSTAKNFKITLKEKKKGGGNWETIGKGLFQF